MNIKLELDAPGNHGALRAGKVGQRQLIDPQADRTEIRPMIRVPSLSLPGSALFLEGPGEARPGPGPGTRLPSWGLCAGR